MTTNLLKNGLRWMISCAALILALLPTDSLVRADNGAPVWSADPAVVSKLTTTVTLGSYVFKLPDGYSDAAVEGKMPSHSGFIEDVYVPTMRADGTRPTLLIIISTPPPNVSPITTDEGIELIVNSQSATWTNVKVGKKEAGTIDGLTAERVRLEGQFTNAGGRVLSMKGAGYAVADGLNTIMLLANDTSDNSTASFPLLEATAMTFTKSTPTESSQQSNPWVPDPTIAKQLLTTIKVGDYTLQVPDGFRESPSTANGGANTAAGVLSPAVVEAPR